MSETPTPDDADVPTPPAAPVTPPVAGPMPDASAPPPVQAEPLTQQPTGLPANYAAIPGNAAMPPQPAAGYGVPQAPIPPVPVAPVYTPPPYSGAAPVFPQPGPGAYAPGAMPGYPPAYAVPTAPATPAVRLADRQSVIDLRSALPFSAWLRSRELRTVPTYLFLALVVAPTFMFWIANSQTGDVQSAFTLASWLFAGYFGCAWFLLLWVIIRPRLVPWHVGAIIVIALVTELPLAVWLEGLINTQTTDLIGSIFGAGLPEEFAKMVPIAIALTATYVVARRQFHTWLEQSPRTYLFLGAVAGLVFGTGEAVSYVVKVHSIPLINQQAISAGDVYSYMDHVIWRLLTDSISHACWAGIAGYFLGIAINRGARIGHPTQGTQYLREAWLAGIGLLLATFLHGYNDYVVSNGWSPLWILGLFISTALLIAYANAGSMVEDRLLAAVAASRAATMAMVPVAPGGYPPMVAVPAVAGPPPVSAVPAVVQPPPPAAPAPPTAPVPAVVAPPAAAPAPPLPPVPPAGPGATT